MKYLDKNVSASFERDIKDSEKCNHAMKHFSMISNLCWAASSIHGLGNVLLIRIVLILAMKDTYIRMYPMHFPFNIEHGKINIFKHIKPSLHN